MRSPLWVRVRQWFAATPLNVVLHPVSLWLGPRVPFPLLLKTLDLVQLFAARAQSAVVSL